MSGTGVSSPLGVSAKWYRGHVLVPADEGSRNPGNRAHIELSISNQTIFLLCFMVKLVCVISAPGNSL